MLLCPAHGSERLDRHLMMRTAAKDDYFSGPLPPGNRTPIGDYALIGDCRTAALVSRTGSIDWFCVPHFSAPPVFASLLDPAAGQFTIRPSTAFRTTRRYAGDSTVLETIFETDTGAVLVRDALVVMEGIARLRPMRELVRIVENLRGEVELEIEIAVRPNFARALPRLRSHGEIGWAVLFDDQNIFVQSDCPLRADANSLRGRLRCTPGTASRFTLALTKTDNAIIPPKEEAAGRVAETARWWRKWSESCRYHGPYRDAVLRSAITLKQLNYALSGAMVAAPSTSLPETIGKDNTWDYRFCWLRDAGFIVEALTSLGFQQDAEDYLGWLLHSTRLSWPRLRVLYDVYGRQCAGENEMSHLEGYRGSRPVRVGNLAGRQFQLDIYGHVILAAERFVAAGGHFDLTEARMLRGLAKTVCKQWRDPDNGLWEIRRARRQYTFSKLMCWVAVDRLLTLERGGALTLGSLKPRFESERDAIRDAIERRGFNSGLQAYTADFDSSHMDASLLLIPWLGYLPASDRRFQGTFACIMQRLSRNGLVYRYETGYGDKDYPEQTFGICTFWAVQALAAMGRVREAEAMFENALTCAIDLLLFGEEIDPDSKSITGNFPQGFTHVGLINAALALANCGGAG
jgi:GH15 family glucan-1,4-alpha-glucosidase